MVLPKEFAIVRRLSQSLRKRKLTDPVVLVMSPGGMRLGWGIAKNLRAPMDVLVALEVIAPGYRQIRIGVVTGGAFVPDQERIVSAGFPADYVERLAERELRRQSAQDRALRRRQPMLDLAGRTVILVDNGWSSPFVAQAVVEVVRQRAAADVVYTSPVCGVETYYQIRRAAEIEVLYPPGSGRTVLLGDHSVAPVTKDEAATMIEMSRRFVTQEIPSSMSPASSSSPIFTRTERERLRGMDPVVRKSVRHG